MLIFTSFPDFYEVLVDYFFPLSFVTVFKCLVCLSPGHSGNRGFLRWGQWSRDSTKSKRTNRVGYRHTDSLKWRGIIPGLHLNILGRISLPITYPLRNLGAQWRKCTKSEVMQLLIVISTMEKQACCTVQVSWVLRQLWGWREPLVCPLPSRPMIGLQSLLEVLWGHGMCGGQWISCQ